MSDLNYKPLTQEQLGELKTLLQNGERVRFYFKYRDYTGSDQAFELSEISSFSNFFGGTAERVNKNLESNPKYPQQGVLWFSKQIADNVYKNIEDSYKSGRGGIITDREMVTAAQEVWDKIGLGKVSPVNFELFKESIWPGSEFDFNTAENALFTKGTINAALGGSAQAWDLFKKFITGKKAEYGKTEKDFDLTSGNYKTEVTKDMEVFYIRNLDTGEEFTGETGATKVGENRYVVTGKSKEQISLKYNIPVEQVTENTPTYTIEHYESGSPLAPITTYTITVDGNKTFQYFDKIKETKLPDEIFQIAKLMELRNQKTDPLILDLAGQELELISAKNSGISFLLSDTNTLRDTGWACKNAGFLAIDKNQNGIIDNGEELLGNNNGFYDLLLYDDNKDYLINQQDAIYKDLLIWEDINCDGISQKEEITSLTERGVAWLSLKYKQTIFELNENLVTATASYLIKGKSHNFYSVHLAISNSFECKYNKENNLINTNQDKILFNCYGELLPITIASEIEPRLKANIDLLNVINLEGLNKINMIVESSIFLWSYASGCSLDYNNKIKMKKCFLKQVVNSKTNENLLSDINTENAWNIFSNMLIARILVQGPLKFLFPKTVYSVFDDLIVINDTSNNIINSIENSRHSIDYKLLYKYVLVITNSATCTVPFDHDYLKYFFDNYQYKKVVDFDNNHMRNYSTVKNVSVFAMADNSINVVKKLIEINDDKLEELNKFVESLGLNLVNSIDDEKEELLRSIVIQLDIKSLLDQGAIDDLTYLINKLNLSLSTNIDKSVYTKIQLLETIIFPSNRYKKFKDHVRETKVAFDLFNKIANNEESLYNLEENQLISAYLSCFSVADKISEDLLNNTLKLYQINSIIYELFIQYNNYFNTPETVIPNLNKFSDHVYSKNFYIIKPHELQLLIDSIKKLELPVDQPFEMVKGKYELFLEFFQVKRAIYNKQSIGKFNNLYSELNLENKEVKQSKEIIKHYNDHLELNNRNDLFSKINNIKDINTKIIKISSSNNLEDMPAEHIEKYLLIIKYLDKYDSNITKCIEITKILESNSRDSISNYFRNLDELGLTQKGLDTSYLNNQCIIIKFLEDEYLLMSNYQYSDQLKICKLLIEQLSQVINAVKISDPQNNLIKYDIVNKIILCIYEDVKNILSNDKSMLLKDVFRYMINTAHTASEKINELAQVETSQIKEKIENWVNNVLFIGENKISVLGFKNAFSFYNHKNSLDGVFKIFSTTFDELDENSLKTTINLFHIIGLDLVHSKEEDLIKGANFINQIGIKNLEIKPHVIKNIELLSLKFNYKFLPGFDYKNYGEFLHTILEKYNINILSKTFYNDIKQLTDSLDILGATNYYDYLYKYDCISNLENLSNYNSPGDKLDKVAKFIHKSKIVDFEEYNLRDVCKNLKDFLSPLNLNNSSKEIEDYKLNVISNVNVKCRIDIMNNNHVKIYEKLGELLNTYDSYKSCAAIESDEKHPKCSSMHGNLDLSKVTFDDIATDICGKAHDEL